MKRIKNLISSFNYAVNGIVYSLKMERNMKIHFFIALLVLIMGLLFGINKVELLILFITIAIVFFAEMINTSIEVLSDLITKEYHPEIKIIKDIAAGAVLVVTLNAVIVGYLIFFKDLKPLTLDLLFKIQQTPIHLTVITLILIILIVLAIKSCFNRGTPLQGGMPSGHTAIAFGLMIIVSMLSKDALIATLALLMAILTAESRIETHVHTVWEVIVGAVVGTLIGALIFQMI